MNRIYSSFICHQNNTRTQEFKIFKNKFVLNLINKMCLEGNLDIIEDTGKELVLLKKKDYWVSNIKPNYPITYLECLKLIKRRTDLSEKRNIFFSTSKGLLTIKEIEHQKVGGVPLFMIEYK